MDSLTRILPTPIHQVVNRIKPQPSSKLVPLIEVDICPPYDQREGWIARKPEDYGDGGSFPEINMPQFPFGMGFGKIASTSNAIAKQVDAEGRIKYEALTKLGQRPDKIIYSKATDLLPKTFDVNDESLLRPEESDLKEDMEKTNSALQKIASERINAAMPVKTAEKQDNAVYVRYTPSQQGSDFNSGAKQSIIKIHDVQVDPMEPPKFRTNKKIPREEPSPPAPVLHSPNKKISVKEQQEWKIPPCVSNWKNAKGYTIALDKRLAADGRGLQEVHTGEKFAKFSESLLIAERKAREEIDVRAQMEKKIHLKEKEVREEKLKMLANEARQQRSGIAKTLDKEAETRDELRKDLARERQRERNIARAAPEKRNRLQRDRERDISEKIALGLPNAGAREDSMYDQRLFDQSKGLDSGFAGGEDGRYDVYDAPWGGDRNIANTMYKASKGTDGYGGNREPVQFEKDDDPFGLNKFLDDAKKGQKRKDLEEKDNQEPSKKPRKN